MAKRLYVGNLPFTVTDQDLQNTFGEVGELASASVVIDRATDRSKGFGFVEYVNDADADTAIEKFNGQDMGGRNLTVNEARPREERPRGNFGGGNRGNW
jgi:cold-inducible RNA-binding protein